MSVDAADSDALLVYLYQLIKGVEGVSFEGISRLVSDEVPVRDRKLLEDVLLSLRDSRISYTLDLESRRILAFSEFSCAAISIMTDGCGRLRRLHVIPEYGISRSARAVAEELSKADLSYQLIFIEGDQCLFYKNVETVAVSSLSKLYLCEIVYRAIEEKLLTWDTEISIRNDDIRVRSAGLSQKNVGSVITVRSLLIYALIASDNSAADLLLGTLRNLGASSSDIENMLVNAKTTIETYGAEVDDPTKEFTSVVWNRGKDCFFSLKRLAMSMQYLCETSWTPWDELRQSPVVYAYKGGQAPGVLSGMWASRATDRGGGSPFVLVGYAVNYRKPFTYIDEVWIVSLVSGLFTSRFNLKSGECGVSI